MPPHKTERLAARSRDRTGAQRDSLIRRPFEGIERVIPENHARSNGALSL